MVEALVGGVQPGGQPVAGEAAGVVRGVAVGEPVGHHEVELLLRQRLAQRVLRDRLVGVGGRAGQRGRAEGQQVGRVVVGERQLGRALQHQRDVAPAGDAARAVVLVPRPAHGDLQAVAARRDLEGAGEDGGVGRAAGRGQGRVGAGRVPVGRAPELALHRAGEHHQRRLGLGGGHGRQRSQEPDGQDGGQQRRQVQTGGAATSHGALQGRRCPGPVGVRGCWETYARDPCKGKTVAARTFRKSVAVVRALTDLGPDLAARVQGAVDVHVGGARPHRREQLLELARCHPLRGSRFLPACSARADHPLLVPDRLGRLDHAAVGAGTPGTGRTRARTTGRASPPPPCPRRRPAPPPAPRPSPGRGCRSARRAAAGWRRTARAAGSAAAPAGRRRASRRSARPGRRARSGPAPGWPARGRGRRGARRRGAGSSSRVRPARSGRVCVCANQPGRTRAPSRTDPVWATGSTCTSPTGRCSRSGSEPPAASSRRKCDLPDPLEPSTATRSPNHSSASNGCIRPVSPRPSATTTRLPVRPPRSRMVTFCSRGRSCGGPASSNLRSRVWAAWYREARPSLNADLVLYISTSALQLGVLLVPAPAQLVQPLEPGPARVVPGGERAGVHPQRAARRAGLEGGDPGRHPVEQLAVVAHQQHRLAGGDQPLLQPLLAGDVEVVVRLVEQQHLVRPAQQRLQHEPLLLAAGQRPHLAPPAGLVRDAERRDRDGVPQRLGLVPAGVGVVRERVGVPHLRRARRRPPSSPARRRRRRARPSRSAGGDTLTSRSRTVVPSRTDPMNWRMTPRPAAARDRTLVRGEVTRDDPQQRGLARAVRADQRGAAAVADAEGHLVQQRTAVRQRERDGVDVDVAHGTTVPSRGPAGTASSGRRRHGRRARTSAREPDHRGDRKARTAATNSGESVTS